MATAVLWLIFRFFPVVPDPFVNELSGLWDISLWSPTEYKFDEAKVETQHTRRLNFGPFGVHVSHRHLTLNVSRLDASKW